MGQGGEGGGAAQSSRCNSLRQTGCLEPPNVPSHLHTAAGRVGGHAGHGEREGQGDLEHLLASRLHLGSVADVALQQQAVVWHRGHDCSALWAPQVAHGGEAKIDPLADAIPFGTNEPSQIVSHRGFKSTGLRLGRAAAHVREARGRG